MRLAFNSHAPVLCLYLRFLSYITFSSAPCYETTFVPQKASEEGFYSRDKIHTYIYIQSELYISKKERFSMLQPRHPTI